MFPSPPTGADNSAIMKLACTGPLIPALDFGHHTIGNGHSPRRVLGGRPDSFPEPFATVESNTEQGAKDWKEDEDGGEIGRRDVDPSHIYSV